MAPQSRCTKVRSLLCQLYFPTVGIIFDGVWNSVDISRLRQMISEIERTEVTKPPILMHLRYISLKANIPVMAHTVTTLLKRGSFAIDELPWLALTFYERALRRTSLPTASGLIVSIKILREVRGRATKPKTTKVWKRFRNPLRYAFLVSLHSAV
jgi:hypothetical protein